jgi:23S rRNA (cytidine2498-2'-O)-methyltransferase
VTPAYLAAEGFERQLDDELAGAGVAVRLRHGRLRVSESPPVHAAWAANT